MVEKKMLRYNTTDRVEYIYAKLNYLGLSRTVIKQILDADAQCIRDILLSCNDVTISGVGTLKIGYKKPTAAREGYNFHTHDKMLVPAVAEHNRVSFSAVKSLRDALKEKTLGDAIVPDRTKAKAGINGEETDSE